MMTESLHLSLLGKLRISRAGVPVSGFVSSKAEALLCYLAVTGRVHYRHSLVGLLWGNMPEKEAKASLRVVLSNLRRLVGPHLTISRQTVAFNRDAPYRLDIEDFRAKVEIAATKPDVEQLHTAIELYQGDFLEGFYVRDAPDFEEWVVVQRESLRELALQTLYTLAAHYTTQREAGWSMAINYTTRLLSLDPWREEAHQQLMLLLARSRQWSAALAQYQTCRRILAEELGVEPMPETTNLYNRIRLAASTPQHNLPAQSTPFVGREKELAKIGQYLVNPACRLLVLVGPGGMGKTRLALQAAAEQVKSGSFLDGVYFIPLAALSSVNFLASTIAEAINFSFYSNEEPKAQLLSYLRDTNREMLLVLDNFEHLLVDQSIDLLTDILKQTTAIKLLITSKQRLNLQGEWCMAIYGMNVPLSPSPNSAADKEKDRAEIEDYDAIQLFQQSARQIQADFSLSAAEKPFAIRICQLVEGMPLGIELAAAWVRVLSCADIVQEIERSLDFLNSSLRDVPERHQSLRTVFEHSWQFLSDVERNALRKLAVFQGGFRREAAQRITRANLPLLSTLVDKSFLRWNGTAPGQAAGYYEMHKTLQQYVAEKFYQSDPQEIINAGNERCSYYGTFLRQREQLLQGGQQKEALQEIGEEIENIRAAWHWAISHKKVVTIQQYINSLFLFHEIRGRYQEGEEIFKQAVAALAEAIDAATASDPNTLLVFGQVLARQGAFQHRLSQYETAELLLQKSLNIFHTLDNQTEIAFSLNQLGNVSGARGEYHQAKEYYQDSLTIKRQLGDQYGIAVALNNLGYIAYLLGEYPEARQHYQESMTLCQQLDDCWGMALALNNLGLVANALGEYPEAKQHFQDSLTICHDIGDQFVTVLTLNNLGLVAEAMGGLVEAKQRYQESLVIGQGTGNRRLMALSLNNLGAVAYELKAYMVARQRYRESLAIRREIGDQLGLVYTLNGLGNVAIALQEFEEARQNLSEALRVANTIQATPATLEVLIGLAKLLATGVEGEKEKAAELLLLVLRHPASEKETKDQADRLLAELKTELSSDVMVVAQEKAQAISLEAVVTKIMGLLDPTSSPAHV